jgi:ferredoxin
MPDRYHVRTALTPARFRRIGKFGSIDWREDCSRCTNCVKLRCGFDVYTHESLQNHDPMGAIETLYECKACLSCVQGCTKGLLNLSVNPEFLEMGDEYWKPDTILSTWNQSDSGTIPVSGAGYRGPFHGPDFDSIWTDMSEIVRPTRDGIHGREYISSSVDIGSKPMRLTFTPDGAMLTEPPPLLEIQIPAILDVPAWSIRAMKLAEARAMAAKELRTVATVFAREFSSFPPDLLPYSVPIFAAGNEIKALVDRIGSMVQLVDSSDVLQMADLVRSLKPRTIISVRIPLQSATADRIIDLSRNGIKVFQLWADANGRERADNGRHIKDALREIHGRLVTSGIRDEITLIVSGGIALAEHMAKAIICGSDLVGVDTALLVALGCRVCRQCNSRFEIRDSKSKLESRISNLEFDCPIQADDLETEYAAQRMINLIGAWHSQLIEVLGAMGIREVRRLRGEMGRAIFVEEIEKEAFGDLFRMPSEEASA